MKNNQIVLGTWQFGGSFGYWEDQEKEESRRVIRAALKKGITTFDTAYSYQNAESLIAPLLPKEVKIYTKVPAVLTMRQKAETSLKRLKRSSVDTIFIHWPTRDSELLKASVETLFNLKAEGLCKNVGYSNFPLSLLESFPAPDKLEMPISLLWMKDLTDIQSYCKEKAVRLIGYSPLSMGLLSGKYKSKSDLKDQRASFYALSDSLKFSSFIDTLSTMAKEKSVQAATLALAWAREQSDETIIGIRNTKQLEESFSTVTLSENEINYLAEEAKKLTNNCTFDNPFGHRW